MNYNYHTHTKYCRHASGEMEEYVQYALSHGIRYFGFSEHSPFLFPDGYQSTYHRVFVEETPQYLAEANRLREKYKDRMDITIGYEMEYYPLYFPQMLKMALDYDAEYLILGQHYLGSEHPDGYPAGVPTENDNDLVEYTQAVLDGIKTGVFTYVAHPDFVNYKGTNDALYEQEMKKICLASKEYNIPLEINFGGARAKENYPSDRFFKIAGEVGCPITMGMDAHTVEAAFDAENIQMGKEMIRRYHLNYIGKPNLILLQDKKEELLKKFSLA